MKRVLLAGFVLILIAGCAMSQEEYVTETQEILSEISTLSHQIARDLESLTAVSGKRDDKEFMASALARLDRLDELTDKAMALKPPGKFKAVQKCVVEMCKEQKTATDLTRTFVTTGSRVHFTEAAIHTSKATEWAREMMKELSVLEP